jgi:5'-methylthioadenosine phosphorylase
MQGVDYGIIGGSGLYAMEGFEARERVALKTPFGEPSDAYVVGTLGNRRVAFLPRHGEGHRILPSELNFKANIYGFKILGVRAILSASAVGSLHESIHPGDILVPDQLVDRTRHREDTFFGEGIVAHVGFADPFCPILRERLVAACQHMGLKVHGAGTYLCMEGPHFSTRAESFLYRAWGMDVIGMTNLQEAKLAREAEVCYATLALVTDYDCWHPAHDSVQIADVLKVLHENSVHAQAVLRRAASQAPPDGACGCQSALENAVVTRRDLWPDAIVHRLRPLLGRLMEKEREAEA